MNLPRRFKVLVQGPCFSRSGYGGVADGLVPMLIQYPHFETRVSLTNWGACAPRQSPGPHDDLIKHHVWQWDGKTDPKADIFITLDMPEAVNPVGRIFNILFTAGLEVDRCPDYYMQALNRWDLTVFQSRFGKWVCENSNIKPTRKLEILGWSQDTDVFKIDPTPNQRVEEMMAGVKEDEAFLFVGQRTAHNPWLSRKNECLLIQTFCRAFKGREKRPALIMKYNGVNFSNYDRDGAAQIIRQVQHPIDPTAPIYLAHGEMTDSEMAALYNHPKIIACTSFTRGEGFGGSLLQSSLCGKPTIASNWSGHLDYLDDGLFIPLTGELKEIPAEAVSNWFQAGSKWFEVNPDAAVSTLQQFVFDEEEKSLYKSNDQTIALELAALNAKRFNLAEQQRQLYRLLDKHLFGRV